MVKAPTSLNAEVEVLTRSTTNRGEILLWQTPFTVVVQLKPSGKVRLIKVR